MHVPRPQGASDRRNQKCQRYIQPGTVFIPVIPIKILLWDPYVEATFSLKKMETVIPQ